MSNNVRVFPVQPDFAARVVAEQQAYLDFVRTVSNALASARRPSFRAGIYTGLLLSTVAVQLAAVASNRLSTGVVELSTATAQFLQRIDAASAAISTVAAAHRKVFYAPRRAA